jgi:hypothetical protein
MQIFNLHSMVENCIIDTQIYVFLNEELLLQSYACSMGVDLGKSPIAHPEVAGEGIESDLGAGMIHY